MKKKIAMAIGAHPDDIEFMMAGTLILLKEAGYETHCLNLANGSCGSNEYSPEKLRAIRKREGQAAASVLGAVFHPSLVGDLDIYYTDKTLRRLAALIREVKPSILLVPSPQDYMEDHTNTCRLSVTAAFVRCMQNFKTTPSRKPIDEEVTLYHAMPQGLRDSLRRCVIPGAFVNITSVVKTKTAALSQHKSQQAWLDVSQKMNQYLLTMEKFSLEVGRISRRFRYAEGWRRHMHYGFCGENADPLKDALGKKYLVNRAYERALESGSQF